MIVGIAYRFACCVCHEGTTPLPMPSATRFVLRDAFLCLIRDFSPKLPRSRTVSSPTTPLAQNRRSSLRRSLDLRDMSRALVQPNRDVPGADVHRCPGLAVLAAWLVTAE